ncbi:MAG TPA: alpha-2-macroglobulin family protein, partial [Kofleriaceae bacterium]|nr:alpha-2-macroglobulin family protein [Kofleriaceae bacterium]
ANMQMAWAPVRVFPAPNYEARYDGPRVDFRETIHWQPQIKTGADGTAKVSFYLSDAITGFRAIAEGASGGGLAGHGEAVIQSKLPVSLSVKMPLEVSAGDRIELPVILENETDDVRDVTVAASFGPAFRVEGEVPGKLTLKAGERRSFHPVLRVIGNGKVVKDGAIAVAIDTGNLKDAVERNVRVVPLGFPREVSAAGTLERSARHEVDLTGALPGTLDASLILYPSPLATMTQGTEAIIREPYGCFEQASSANYPNIMVLSYLEENQAADPALVERTMGMLDHGYKMLTGYESPQKGFEWFGGDPGHEALTAYGLMEFRDMGKVYGDVNRDMVGRTRAWLMARRDGKGGYQRNPRALDSFGSASPEVTNGYITWALSEAGEKDMATEVAVQRTVAAESKDPYLVALAAGTLANVEPKAGGTAHALDRLAEMQGEDGAFHGASHSITRSGGDALDIETTSLAILAMLDGGNKYTGAVRKGIDWLNNHRSGFGSFSSTQATVLALKAMGAYAEASRATPSGGRITVIVNGSEAGHIDFEQGHRDPLTFNDLAPHLKAGKNVIELRMGSQTSLPYSLAIEYRSKMPASSPNAKAALTTRLTRDQLPVGEGVKMKVSVRNVTKEGIPMTLARVGIPGGLTFQTWQLKELRDKKLIDFYETREREVVLYFRSMAPGKVVDVDLDLMAQVPGEYTAPASRAYLYYTDEDENWAEPVRVKVTR